MKNFRQKEKWINKGNDKPEIDDSQIHNIAKDPD